MIDPGDQHFDRTSTQTHRIHTHYIINNKFLTLSSRQKSVKKFKKYAPNGTIYSLIFQKASASEGGTSPLRHPPGAARRGAMAALQPYFSREI